MLPKDAWTRPGLLNSCLRYPLPPKAPKLCFLATLNRPFSFSEQYHSLLQIKEHRRILSCHFWGVFGRVQTRAHVAERLSLRFHPSS